MESPVNNDILKSDLDSANSEVSRLTERVSELEVELRDARDDCNYWIDEDSKSTDGIVSLRSENIQLKQEIERYKAVESKEVIHSELDAIQKAFNKSTGVFSFHPSEIGSSLKEFGYDRKSLHDIGKSDIVDSLYEANAEDKISKYDIQRSAEGLGITVQALERHRTH